MRERKEQKVMPGVLSLGEPGDLEESDDISDE